ncbi:hypothetical protein PN497_09555 [Sphaerospermopsis kisseleviana CS-549]|uniref:Uncharacterized protein n=1 Tax=Sphaerospermopsis kisseleviana CS-549 TaxID=3021783 RepID=A0ABT4ZQC8_9CYAN|nr:hypothetical protein [Sphaerospermopsis kisseleviana]MDB9441602.1 hypothetical protein [Sphaerospermopsis kisseleviana CS-549]BAZ79455.1 hypothetical protein NIES73_06990 [Sphaerospermopsis kisseleviana NIES-73]
MEQINLEIDRLTLKRAKTLAMLNQSSVSELLTKVIARLAEIQEQKDQLKRPINGIICRYSRSC